MGVIETRIRFRRVMMEPFVFVMCWNLTAIYQHLLSDRKFGLTHNLLATKVMPTLIPLTVAPGLSIDQVALYLGVDHVIFCLTTSSPKISRTIILVLLIKNVYSPYFRRLVDALTIITILACVAQPSRMTAVDFDFSELGRPKCPMNSVMEWKLQEG